MADEPAPETPEPEPPETPDEPEEPVAPPAPRRGRKPKDAGQLSDNDVNRIAGQLKELLLEGFREAGVFDPPLDVVAPPSQPTAPPPPSAVAPADEPAPPPPQKTSIAARMMS